MDADHRRSDDFGEEHVIRQFFPDQQGFHESARAIRMIRLVCRGTRNTTVEVFVDDPEKAGFHVWKIVSEIGETPFAWGTEVRSVKKAIDSDESYLPSEPRNASIFSYCLPSGIVSAGITKRILTSLNTTCRVTCGYESTGDLATFWTKTMPKFPREGTDVFAFIGMPVAIQYQELVLQNIADLVARSKSVFYSHHHARSFEAFPSMLQRGATVCMGDPWSAFFGSTVTEADFFWARIAALSARDSSQLVQPMTKEENDVLHGLLCLFHQRLQDNPVGDMSDLVDAIADNDRGLLAQAACNYDKTLRLDEFEWETQGKVLLVKGFPDQLRGRLLYNSLDALMETAGLNPGPQTSLKHPYAAAMKNAGGRYRVLLQSWWGDNHIVPIRYLHSFDESKMLGDDHAVWQEFDSEQAAQNAISAAAAQINDYYDTRASQE
jgi:hypothetical protein